jgi:hypothetical protein
MRFILIVLTLITSVDSFSQDQAIKTTDSRKRSGSVCEQSENYLSDEITNLRKKKTLSAHILNFLPFSQTVVKRDCVQSALKQVTAGRDLEQSQINSSLREKFSENNFIRCDADKRVLRYQETPCQSRDSILLMHNSFELVTGCLKDYVSDSSDLKVQNQWAQTYFRMLTKESGLQNYVTSRSQAMGSAQLTKIYIRDFIDNSLDEVKSHLAASAHPICQRLGLEILSPEAVSYFVKKKSAGSYSYNTCALVGVEHNQILRNLLIGFSNLKLFRTRARQSAFKGHSQVQLSAKEELKLELQMVPLAYNLGSGGLNRSIDKSLKTFSVKRPIRTAEEFMQTIIRNTSSAEARNYLSNIDKRFSTVVKESGQTNCFNK